MWSSAVWFGVLIPEGREAQVRPCFRVHLVTALSDVAILGKDLRDPGEGNQGIKSRDNDLCRWSGPTRCLGIVRIRLQVVGSLSQAGTREVEVDVDVAEPAAAFGQTRIWRGGVIFIVLLNSISQLLQ